MHAAAGCSGSLNSSLPKRAIRRRDRDPVKLDAACGNVTAHFDADGAALGYGQS
jgi:hypothetical protein